MSFEGVYEIAGIGIPKFAGTVVAASNELIAVFVEAAIGEGQHMSLQFLHKQKLLFSLFLDFAH